MTPSGIVDCLFLDAQAYEAASFNFESHHFSSLAKHLGTGRMQLLITDVTKTEVKKRVTRNVEIECAALTKNQKSSRVLRTSPLASALLSQLDPTVIADSICQTFEAFLDEYGATVIAATAENAASIFERYFNVEPPFGTGDKRKEFPDAFVAAALCRWSEDHGVELFVVSQDELFGKAFAKTKSIHVVADLTALLDHIASDNEKLADFVREEINDHLDEIKKAAIAAFQDLGFHVEDEWGEATVTVTRLEIDGKPEIVEIAGTEATVELQMTAHYEAELSYEDSDTGIWDSEEGEKLFMEEVNETVEGEHDLVVSVHATFDGVDSDVFEISHTELTDPPSGFGIATSKNAGYPWK